jgi:multiple sugar transport system substrate-binding protein
MPPLILSSMIGDDYALNFNEFKAKNHYFVQHKYFPWDSALSELINVALRSQGPDVSQIGCTWLGSLTGMVALRMFRDAEIQQFGGMDAFLASAWESSSLLGVEDCYAIPWLTDVRLLVYRRDILEKVGVDETTAFVNTEAFEDTLAKLQSSGIQMPLAMSTTDDVLFSLVSWVWGAGGTIRTQDHRHLTLTDGNTIMGIKRYYQLHRYFVPEAQNLNLEQSANLFLQGKAAITFASYANLQNLLKKNASAINIDSVALAPVPGVPIIGGSNLVIWLHSFQEDAAVKLIQHLVSPETQKSIFLNTGELPARAELYSTKFFTTDRFLQTVILSLKMGKVFQSSRKWAIIETRLQPALSGMWSALFDDPDINLEKEIGKRFAGVQKSIEQALLRTHPLI